MQLTKDQIRQFETQGFLIIPEVFTLSEVLELKQVLSVNPDVHAVRQLFKKCPDVWVRLCRNKAFNELLQPLMKDRFAAKSIYFNKPKQANWFVSYHQDVSIGVEQKIEADGFAQWTFKQGQLGVVPPKQILEELITCRIHLDDTDGNNGALRVIPGSHQHGILRLNEASTTVDWSSEVCCTVPKGGIMLMKPLLLHASNKSVSSEERAVVHIEFAASEIPMGWLEKYKMN